MNEFKRYHPIVNFAYFVFVIGFSCFFMHPVCLAVSLVCGFIYSVMLKGKKQIKTNLIYMFVILISTALFNSAFNHEGVTVIKYLPSGNPLTLESVIYGFAAAAMIVCVIFHFSCYNEIMTSDKFMWIFGKIIPSLSLIISMTLRFVPRFATQLKVVANAQKCMGRNSGGSVIKRAKNGLNILSVMITWSLENAIETADSMKARGYGLPGRTAFSVYTFGKRDKNVFSAIMVLGLYTLAEGICGKVYFGYFPFVQAAKISPFGISVLASYLLLCIIPIIIELWEAARWKLLRSKI